MLLSTLPLLLLLAQPPSAAPPLGGAEPRFQLRVGPLSLGLGFEIPLGAENALSLEGGAGLHWGFGSVAEQHGGSFYEVLQGSVAWRRYFGDRAAVDLGARASGMLWNGEGELGGGRFFGLYVQPSFGGRRFRVAATLMAGLASPREGLLNAAVVLQPLSFIILF